MNIERPAQARQEPPAPTQPEATPTAAPAQWELEGGVRGRSLRASRSAALRFETRVTEENILLSPGFSVLALGQGTELWNSATEGCYKETYQHVTNYNQKLRLPRPLKTTL
ncbi:Hypothetical predicted protein [Podarcis lilfordi]|uniref:Uncharacterized protein n=1 Tax=Podarcis lilfordi TaxID=74358 RepID=A0AA35JRG6_9SAUR|nr:Hypothetical predicted protein [Podarcis lilfordi]